ncbi:glycosyl hydrolase family 2 [Motilibacter peucedani]|uniref:Glycosyl hydrolase family 2 n=1 Tax=Motilibacter peucedani TaxID=598650 RepID=A0A420XNK9_9ACTN|nr:LamG-like jellyroll fold domain-containing protein [Motilibacter peucedani]RKS73779.1 glycosyl hydrolase family 2 [Motilibacter peucedani]
MRPAQLHPEPPRSALRRRRPLLSRGVLGVAALALLGSFATAAPAQADPNPLHGLKGDYYRSSGAGIGDFHEFRTTQIDPNLDFGSLEGVLTSTTGQADQDSVRWTGQLVPDHSEAYTFSAIGDNGFRIWIGGQLVIDHWVDDWDNRQTSAPVQLEAGKRYDVKVEYFEDFGGSNLHLSWSSPSTPSEPIPASAFYLPEGYEPPVNGTAAVDASGTHATLDIDTDFKPLPADISQHVTVAVDDIAFPLASVALDGSDASKLILTTSTPITKGSLVRITYDGKSTLATTKKTLPEFNVAATNGSTYTLSTPWASQVSPSNALPDYPRPQLTRTKWQNLNGTWQFAATDSVDTPPVGQTLGEKILVPYPVESVLSGVQRHEDRMFYRRTFTVPADWNIGSGARLKLNFGAVDYAATVWVNGTKVAEHTGGYDQFSADITDAVTGSGPQEVIVGVVDTTDSGNQATGKQTNNPGGIFYTPASGIWQTVWLEPVAPAHVDSLKITSDVPGSDFKVTAESASASAGASVTVVASKDGKTYGSVTGAANTALTLSIANPHLWSPDDPYLYDLKVTLTDGGSTDTVGSYQGLRSIGLKVINGKQRIVLNGKPTFLLSTLDQGYWPDGIYTAPTDEALAFDLVQHKEMGFNTVRKHIKVEPDRWYYWADRLGLMVWQDIPAGFFTNDTARANFQTQLHRIVDQHDSDTSVIGFIPFNEGWGEWDRTVTGQIADSVKAQDPTRLVDAHSGVNCCASKGDSGHGDVIDWHMYNGPAFPSPDANRAAMDGEHGGYGLVIPGHTWPGGSLSNYGTDLKTTADLTNAYVSNTSQLIGAASCGLSGSVYTQITDVETELNGLWTYDRRVEKVDPAQVKAVNEKVIAAGASTGSVVVKPGKPGLVGTGYWPLDEGSGTVTEDLSGGAHDGTLVNGPTWTAGTSGKALQFNGSNQFVDTGAQVLDTSGSYTVSAWAKIDRTDGFATVVSQDGAQASDFFLQYSGADHVWAFSYPQTRALATGVGTPQVGRWYHLTGVRDLAAGEIRIYVDGKLAGSASVCGGANDPGNLVIGRGKFNGGAVDFFPGAIDSVHAYDRVLSDSEIASLAAGEPSVTRISDVSTALDRLAASGGVPASTARSLRSTLSAASAAEAAHDFGAMRAKLQSVRATLDAAPANITVAARTQLTALLDALLPARTPVQAVRQQVGTLTRSGDIVQSTANDLQSLVDSIESAQAAGDSATATQKAHALRDAVSGAKASKVSATAKSTLLPLVDALL